MIINAELKRFKKGGQNATLECPEVCVPRSLSNALNKIQSAHFWVDKHLRHKESSAFKSGEMYSPESPSEEAFSLPTSV